MPTDPPLPLADELHEAQDTLQTTLSEACGTDPARADTGELIRIEEMLAIASDAAKRAISIRRRRKSRVDPPVQPAAGDTPAAGQRTFELSGVRWSVWAVHPNTRSGAKQHLLGSYQQGWLAFECAQSKKRLSPIPEGWETLEDGELALLCTSAKDVARRSGRGRTSREEPGPAL